MIVIELRSAVQAARAHKALTKTFSSVASFTYEESGVPALGTYVCRVVATSSCLEISPELGAQMRAIAERYHRG
jgi:hypothetical protein